MCEKMMKLILTLLLILISITKVEAQNFGFGTDRSANPPSLAGLTLLTTFPNNTGRIGYFIQVKCTAGAIVVLDDAAGSLTATILRLDGPAVAGGQGGAITANNTTSVVHTGRIRVYSSDAACSIAAREY